MKHLLPNCRKKLVSIIVLCIAVVLPLALSAGNTKGASDQDGVSSNVRPAARLQRVLNSFVEIDNVSNAALFVEVGNPPASFQTTSDSFVFQGSSGQAHQKLGVAMTPDHPFRIASATKTMTSVIVLHLVEADYVSLDTQLEEIFTDNDMPDGYRVADLHVLQGVRRGNQITVHQLLNHTSGLEDYLSYNNGTGDGPDALALADALAGGASGAAYRQWSAQDLLAHYFRTERGIVPAGMPGDMYYYSDTNYLLLGLIIEKLTGDSYASQLRSRIFEPLNMNRSYLEWYEPVHGESPVEHHLYLGEALGNPGVVSLAINTSFDWAGGGVVSTVSDLNNFVQALVKGDLFEQQATISLMQAWVPDEDGEFYGLGLERFALRGTAFVGHSGFWGAYIYYLPELETSIVLWINQAATDPEPYLIRVLDILAKSGLAMPGSPLETFTKGEDMPVVVFETGLGSELVRAWESVFFDVADFATAFAYNRRGYGDSEFAFPDSTTVVRSGLEAVEELRQTLQSEQLQPPYVLVGHSLGGGNVELFAKMYPEEVAGVMFVDPLPAGFSNACIQKLGLEGCDVPEAVLATLPDVIRAEHLGFKETEQLIASLGGFADTPVIVLSRTQPTDTPEELAVLALRQDMLQAMAAQSTQGTYLAVPGAGHFIQHDAPETVIQSIQQLVMHVRN